MDDHDDPMRSRGEPDDRSTDTSPADQGPTKVCPDCGETVKAAARICRFCRHDFEADVTGPAQKSPPAAEAAGEWLVRSIAGEYPSPPTPARLEIAGSTLTVRRLDGAGEPIASTAIAGVTVERAKTNLWISANDVDWAILTPRAGTDVAAAMTTLRNAAFTSGGGSWMASASTRTPGLSTEGSGFSIGAAAAVAGGALMFAGSFLPWITLTAAFVGNVGRNGVDGGGDGMITAILGVIAAFGGLARFASGGNAGVRAIAAVCGILALGVLLLDFGSINDRVTSINDSSTGIATASIGFGYFMVAVGGVLAIVSAFMSGARVTAPASATS